MWANSSQIANSYTVGTKRSSGRVPMLGFHLLRTILLYYNSIQYYELRHGMKIIIIIIINARAFRENVGIRLKLHQEEIIQINVNIILYKPI